jgi:hypothetical protein
MNRIKLEAGIPTALFSCHTAFIDDYVVEGHVPADVLARLLSERPDIVGVAVAGMPIGSPGMPGSNPEPYTVMAFEADGSTWPFAEITP